VDQIHEMRFEATRREWELKHVTTETLSVEMAEVAHALWKLDILAQVDLCQVLTLELPSVVTQKE